MADEASPTHEEGEIYHRQGFGNRSGVGDRPALVIVDFVTGFADPAAFGGGNIREAIAETQGLLQFARSMKWPVVFTRVVFADDASDANVFTRKVPSLLSLTEENSQSARAGVGTTGGRTGPTKASAVSLRRYGSRGLAGRAQR